MADDPAGTTCNVCLCACASVLRCVCVCVCVCVCLRVRVRVRMRMRVRMRECVILHLFCYIILYHVSTQHGRMHRKHRALRATSRIKTMQCYMIYYHCYMIYYHLLHCIIIISQRKHRAQSGHATDSIIYYITCIIKYYIVACINATRPHASQAPRPPRDQPDQDDIMLYYHIDNITLLSYRYITLS
jgi:hypothetical protein